MKIDYKRSIVNLTHSLFNHYGLNTWHPTLKEVDDTLSNNYDHIALILLDGLGNNLLKLHPGETAFFTDTKVSEITSVFPTTTAAATTAIRTGLTPYESGYLGWFQYFKDEDIHYTILKNKDYYTPEKPIPEGFFEKHFARETIIDKINARGALKAKDIFPSLVDTKNGYESFEDGLKQMEAFQQSHPQTFTYLYSVEPDSTEHDYGIIHDNVKSTIKSLNDSLKALKKRIKPNTLIIVTADHGLSDVTPIPLFDYHDITATFEHLPANDSRMTNFFIKDDMREYFIQFFTEHFGDYFDLYTKQEFLTKKLLGNGEKHYLVDHCLGDFIAVAKDKYFFKLTDEKTKQGHHAGLTNDEVIVPLMMFEGKGE